MNQRCFQCSIKFADYEPTIPPMANRRYGCRSGSQSVLSAVGKRHAVAKSYTSASGLLLLWLNLASSLSTWLCCDAASVCAADTSFSVPNQPGLMKSEFIFEKAPFKQCHASTIVETKGTFVAAWFGRRARRCWHLAFTLGGGKVDRASRGSQGDASRRFSTPLLESCLVSIEIGTAVALL